jgi:uncharacterized protein YndB with AHSA1/START domain
MSESIEVSRAVGAPTEQVWDMVADVTRMGEWSPETTGANWAKGSTGPVAGAQFQGVNRNGTKQWKTTATVLEAEPGKRFWFLVTSVGLKVSEWHYDFEPTAGGCTVTETWIDRRGRMVSLGSPVVSGVKDRTTHNRRSMEQTLDRLADAAESVV